VEDISDVILTGLHSQAALWPRNRWRLLCLLL